MLMRQGLRFTVGERSAITVSLPARGARRYTLSERLRIRLDGLFRPRGTAARVAKIIRDSRVSAGKLTPQQLSMFMSGIRGIHIDSLEPLADALGISIPNLLSIPDETGLSALEQRLIVAIRALDPSVQEHALALLEFASMVSQPPREIALSDDEKRLLYRYRRHDERGKGVLQEIAAQPFERAGTSHIDTQSPKQTDKKVSGKP